MISPSRANLIVLVSSSSVYILSRARARASLRGRISLLPIIPFNPRWGPSSLSNSQTTSSSRSQPRSIVSPFARPLRLFPTPSCIPRALSFYFFPVLVSFSFFFLMFFIHFCPPLPNSLILSFYFCALFAEFSLFSFPSVSLSSYSLVHYLATFHRNPRSALFCLATHSAEGSPGWTQGVVLASCTLFWL